MSNDLHAGTYLMRCAGGVDLTQFLSCCLTLLSPWYLHGGITPVGGHATATGFQYKSDSTCACLCLYVGAALLKSGTQGPVARTEPCLLVLALLVV